jgi:hypothetical protein
VPNPGSGRWVKVGVIDYDAMPVTRTIGSEEDTVPDRRDVLVVVLVLLT